jgi:N-acetylglucosamine-6-phosphate deacetylase
MSTASASNEIRARHFETGRPVRIAIHGGKIAEVVDSPLDDGELWVAPAFWDLQINGRWGTSFSDPSLTVDQVSRIVRAQACLGTARLCPTLITASFASFVHGLGTIAAACETDPKIESRVVGIHLEGPYISERDGYRGAHPIDSVRDPDWDEFRRFQDAAGGRIRLVTLAPERPGTIAFIRSAVASGVTVAIGHTAADGDTLRTAVDAGASLSTHLGNGIDAVLRRHPNPIWEQAALDSLNASFIADGHHLDPSTLRVLARAKSPSRTILVSDASPLAGLPPGTYGSWAVDPSGKIVVAGTPYLAGSNQGLEVGLNMLRRSSGWTLSELLATVTTNPAHLLRLDVPRIQPGEPANLVVFRLDEDEDRETSVPTIKILFTYVDGKIQNAADATEV